MGNMSTIATAGTPTADVADMTEKVADTATAAAMTEKATDTATAAAMTEKATDTATAAAITRNKDVAYTCFRLRSTAGVL